MSETMFTVVCKGCGAEARNLNLVQLFAEPEYCPTCRCPLCGERAHDYRCGA